MMGEMNNGSTLVRFETCNRERALFFLRKLYPSRVIDEKEARVLAVLKLVEDDVLRIPDPKFHSGAIFPSKNYPMARDEQAAVVSTLQDFHDFVTTELETS